MSNERADRIRENFTRRGGRPSRRTSPDPATTLPSSGGPGKRAEEMIVSIAVDEILPDRYQGRLRWPIDLGAIERFYTGEWDAQQLLDYVVAQRQQGESPALEDAWNSIVDLARSILSEGQVAPITVTPSRELPPGYRFVIETGEGRYWAYQMMRWLLENQPHQLDVPRDDWQEDPAFVRAVAISQPSRLRQVAENEQRQSYASAVDRAVAYASMLAEEANYAVEGTPPGIRSGVLELPDAYWRAARRGLRGRKAVVQQVPTGKRQIQRHLKLLTDLDPWVLARAKQNGLSEAQLRPLVGKPFAEQRQMVEIIVEQELSSRQAARLVEQMDEGAQLDELMEITFDTPAPATKESAPPTITEEIARFMRSLTRAASRYEALREQLSDAQIQALLEAELHGYDQTARASQRTRTPRRRIARLRQLLDGVNQIPFDDS